MLAQSSDAAEPGAAPEYGILGRPSTDFSGGRVIGYEHNRLLTGRQWADEVEKMLRTSTAVGVGWWVLRSMLLSATVVAEPPPEASTEPADLINEAFGFDGRAARMSTSWSVALEMILTSLLGGWRVLEEVWRADDDGIWLDYWFDIEPRTLSKWHTDVAGRVTAIEQTSSWSSWSSDVSGKNPVIPADKFLHVAWNVTGQNPEGRGLLRAPWGAWNDLQAALTNLKVAAQRFAVPPIDIEIDLREITEALQKQPDAKWLEDERDLLVEQASNLTSHEHGNVARYKGFGFRPMDVKFDPAPLLSVCQYHEQRILLSMLSQFLGLGISTTGARAVGEVHERVAQMSATHVLDRVAERIGGPPRGGAGTVGRLVKWNLGDVPVWELPALRFDGIRVPAWLKEPGVLGDMVRAGLLTPEDGMEDRLRAGMGLPSRPDAVARLPEERLAISARQPQDRPRRSAADIVSNKRQASSAQGGGR